MRSCIVTNGTRLSVEAARQLKAAGMDTVSVSVDGLQGTHDAIRGRGTWERALDGISNAVLAGMSVVEAITCVRPANLAELPDIEQAVRRAGANLWRMITIDRMGRVAGDPDPALWLGPSHVRQLLAFIRDRRADLARRGEDPETVSFSCGGYLGLPHEDRVRPGHNQCFAGLCVASILSDGQVSACPSLPRAWAQGSALQTRFSEIWRGRFENHRSLAWRRQSICGECSWFPVCLGGGIHERLAQPDSFCWLDRQECAIGT
jgi:radical SAM protein with 4Fe4S-binding SPASM domain